jgi:predicted kinase
MARWTRTLQCAKISTMADDQTLIVLCGPPCSGKSKISDLIRDRLEIPKLEMDTIRGELFPNGSNSPEERRVSYKALHYCAEEMLRGKVSRVLVTATYQPGEQRQAAAEVAFRCHCSLRVIQLEVDPGAAMLRFLGRDKGHPALDLTADRVRELAAHYPFYPRALTLMTSRFDWPEEVYEKVVEAVNGEAEQPMARAALIPNERFAEWVEAARKRDR